MSHLKPYDSCGNCGHRREYHTNYGGVACAQCACHAFRDHTPADLDPVDNAAYGKGAQAIDYRAAYPADTYYPAIREALGKLGYAIESAQFWAKGGDTKETLHYLQESDSVRSLLIALIEQAHKKG